jgi:prepilin signal peptidase PulO-like enzyme (type II secretory pathway)
VVIDRAPRGQSIVYPPSHCPHCRRKLEARDLVPVLSFLVLKGRCRYCSAGIPLRLFVVEVACGLSFMAAALTACLMLIK